MRKEYQTAGKNGDRKVSFTVVKMSLNKEMQQCRFDKIVKALNKCIAF